MKKQYGIYSIRKQAWFERINLLTQQIQFTSRAEIAKTYSNQFEAEMVAGFLPQQYGPYEIKEIR